MADMHVLGGDGVGKWSLVMHFAVPDQDNQVGVNYRVAMVNSGIGGSSCMAEGVEAGQISTAELTQIQAGEVYEYVLPFLAESGASTIAQLLAAAKAAYAREQGRVVADLQKRLKYFGYTGSAS